MEFPRQRREQHAFDASEYSDAPFYSLLKRLPPELAKRHSAHIEQEELTDAEATAYLTEIMASRNEATTISEVSDTHAQELFAGHEAEFFSRIETDVFSNPECHIGAGTTARVKRFDLPDGEKTIPIAIKYLVSPNSKTLSASAEHDMIREVERIKHIEEIERDSSFEYLHVPHPYFHHKNKDIQCYGMEMVDGITLEEGLLQSASGNLDSSILEAVAGVDQRKLEQEFETFLGKMHEYCLHGDIKPKNIMVSRTGQFYLIDFGQSVLVNDITEKAQGQLEVLKDEEIKLTKYIVGSFLQNARKSIAST